MEKEFIVKEIELEIKVLKSFNKYRDYTISNPQDVSKLANEIIGYSDRECLLALYLNIKNVVVAVQKVSIGDLSSAIVSPREIFKSAIIVNASSIILCHNHPSGNLTPSREDINSTKRIKDCSNILGIPLLDHIIVSKDKYLSIKEQGYI